VPAPKLPVVQSMDQLPPGKAGLVVPHEQTFVAVYNQVQQNYSWQFDEALFDNVNNAIAMLFDPVIMEPLETRFRATALLTWHLEPDDAADSKLVEAAADLEKRARRMPFFQQFLVQMMWDTWYGKSGAQVIYNWWRNPAGRMGIVPTGHVPINGDKLVPFYGRTNILSEWGVRVSGVFSQGSSDSSVISDYGRVHKFTQDERQAIVVSQYMPVDADYLRPRKAGQVAGVGLRERLYWFWAIKNQVMGLLADYLRWFAQGLTIYYYELGNEEAYNEVKRRAEENAGKPFLLFPRERTGEPEWKPVERFDPSSASTTLMTELITKYFDEVIRRMILGTGATTIGGPAGLNSGRSAEVQEKTADSVVKFDANRIGEVLTQDYIAVMNSWTYPGYPVPKFTFELDSPNVEELRSSAESFMSWGGQLGEESMRKLLGLPAPKPGENLLGQMQTMQPSAVGALPNGVPAEVPGQEGAPGQLMPTDDQIATAVQGQGA
jgi:hypothetical protein